MGPRVEQVAAERAYELRRDVLRPWMSLAELAESDSPGLTFAALGPGDEPWCCATLLVAEAPELLARHNRDHLPGYRLRNMATHPDHRGEGLGRAVLEAVFAEVAANGGGLLWCHAREGAIAFYEKMGLRQEGERFEIDRIGVHVVMWILLGAAARTGSG